MMVMVPSLLAYFYPRPPRGGRRSAAAGHPPGIVISIHALREEGDGRLCGLEHDPLAFLSTPSARRATTGQLQTKDWQ